jgi:hypothetical protein
MSEPEHAKAKRGCLPWSVGGVVGLVLMLLLLPFAARNVWLFELPYHLVAGCVLHANRALSHFATDLPRLMFAAILPGLATVIALWGTHRLVLWWRRATGKIGGWRFTHTALAGLLLLLGSAAAIALSGVLHELAWLPQGKIVSSNHRMTRTMAMSDARMLGLSLFEFENEHGTYPSSLLDLEKTEYAPPKLRRMMFVDLDPPSPPEPFIYLGSGKTTAGNPSRLLAISPVIPEWDVFVVLRMDNSVTSMPASKFAEVVEAAANEEHDGK